MRVLVIPIQQCPCHSGHNSNPWFASGSKSRLPLKSRNVSPGTDYNPNPQPCSSPIAARQSLSQRIIEPRRQGLRILNRWYSKHLRQVA
jgi:hypothetical protein